MTRDNPCGRGDRRGEGEPTYIPIRMRMDATFWQKLLARFCDGGRSYGRKHENQDGNKKRREKKNRFTGFANSSLRVIAQDAT
jgi:hypothetical protein